MRGRKGRRGGEEEDKNRGRWREWEIKEESEGQMGDIGMEGRGEGERRGGRGGK